MADSIQTIPSRDGSSYEHARDGLRLHRQHQRVLAYMSDGRWHTLHELHELTGDPEASISARLRDLRKPRFGSYGIVREYVERGLFRYRLVMGQQELFTQ